MKSLTIYVATIVAILATGGFTMIHASDVSGPIPIVFSAATIDLDGKSRNEFAAKEPVWVRFSLENASDSKVTLWGRADRAAGVVITVEGDPNHKARALSRPVKLVEVHTRMVFQPRGRITFDILLADWIDITGEGTVNLQATYIAGERPEDLNAALGLKVKGQPLRLETKFSVTLKGQLDKKGLDALLKSVQTLYDSDAVADRLRAVDSVRAIRIAEVVPLLAKAVEDKVEEVQFEAVQSLAVLPYPEVIPVLKKAADSPYASVKRAAQVELERREKH